MILGGWVHRHQLIVIEFLQTENRLLKDRLRGERIPCSANIRVAEFLPLNGCECESDLA